MKGFPGFLSDFVKYNCAPMVTFSKKLYDKKDDMGLVLDMDLKVKDGNRSVEFATTTLTATTKNHAFDTRKGPVFVESKYKLSTTGLEFKKLNDNVDLSLALVTDFDPQGIGNVKLGLKKVQYERAFPVYLGGPFDGSGATLSVGAALEYAGKSVKPIVGVEDMKVQMNAATIGSAVLVAVGLIAARQAVGTGLSLPVPGQGNATSSFDVGLKKGGKRMYVGLGNLGKFKIKL